MRVDRMGDRLEAKKVRLAGRGIDEIDVEHGIQAAEAQPDLCHPASEEQRLGASAGQARNGTGKGLARGGTERGQVRGPGAGVRAAEGVGRPGAKVRGPKPDVQNPNSEAPRPSPAAPHRMASSLRVKPHGFEAASRGTSRAGGPPGKAEGCPRVVEQASGSRPSRQAFSLPHAWACGANLKGWRDNRKPEACSTTRQGRCRVAPDTTACLFFSCLAFEGGLIIGVGAMKHSPFESSYLQDFVVLVPVSVLTFYSPGCHVPRDQAVRWWALMPTSPMAEAQESRAR